MLAFASLLLLPPLLLPCITLATCKNTANSPGLQTCYDLYPDEKQFLVAQLNIIRAKVAKGETEGFPPATGMRALTWDDNLADAARELMCNCSAHTDDLYSQGPIVKNFEQVGKMTSIVATPGSISFARDLTLTAINYTLYKYWYKYLQDYYDYQLNDCKIGRFCQTFKKFIEADSIYVGCGFSKCSKIRMSCFFTYASYESWYLRPYTEGPTASRCPGEFSFVKNGLCMRKEYCTDGSCSCPLTEESCANGDGQVDWENCKCKNCKQGFYGNRCEIPCVDEVGLVICKIINPQMEEGICNNSIACRKSCNFCFDDKLLAGNRNDDDIKAMVDYQSTCSNDQRHEERCRKKAEVGKLYCGYQPDKFGCTKMCKLCNVTNGNGNLD